MSLRGSISDLMTSPQNIASRQYPSLCFTRVGLGSYHEIRKGPPGAHIDTEISHSVLILIDNPNTISKLKVIVQGGQKVQNLTVL